MHRANYYLTLLLPLLPPTNKVCEGYVFTGVCLSTGGLTLCLWGVLVSVWGVSIWGVSVRGSLYPGGGVCPGVSVQGVSVQGGLCPGGLCLGGSLSRGCICQGDPHTVTYGRYASYCNAFLLSETLLPNFLHVVSHTSTYLCTVFVRNKEKYINFIYSRSIF